LRGHILKAGDRSARKSTVCGITGILSATAGRVEIWRGVTEVPRFQIPLIKPGVPISGTRLSDNGVS
jgi:hypothetical protein